MGGGPKCQDLLICKIWQKLIWMTVTLYHGQTVRLTDRHNWWMDGFFYILQNNLHLITLPFLGRLLVSNIATQQLQFLLYYNDIKILFKPNYLEMIFSLEKTNKLKFIYKLHMYITLGFQLWYLHSCFYGKC